MEIPGWAVIKNDVLQAVAFVPIDEIDRHALGSKFCACNVRHHHDKGWTLYKHQAFDHREVDEYFAAKNK